MSEERNNEQVGPDGWTAGERRDLALASPTLAGSTRDEVVQLMNRYASSMPEVAALVTGKPSPQAIVEAAHAPTAQERAAVRRRYPNSPQLWPEEPR